MHAGSNIFYFLVSFIVKGQELGGIEAKYYYLFPTSPPTHGNAVLWLIESYSWKGLQKSSHFNIFAFLLTRAKDTQNWISWPKLTCCEWKDAVQDRRNGSSPGPIPRELGQFFFFKQNSFFFFFFTPWCCSPATLQRHATGLFIKIKFHPHPVAWVQDLTLSLPEDGHDAWGTL